jgi:glycosyltransferase involved in cell wall biosynthesis
MTESIDTVQIDTVQIDTVHLVYSHGPRTACPDAIGRKLGERLATRFEVVHHDWDGFEHIPASPNAALVGHAHPLPFTTFRRSARGDWGRVVLMQPLSTSRSVNGFLFSTLDRVDRFLAIMGPYWGDQVTRSAFGRWADRIEQVDLAVDPSDFPRLRTSSGEPGARRFLYIGSDDACKNLRYLDAIAGAMPEVRFSWAGTGSTQLANVERLGFVDFSSEAGAQVVRDHDFMITVGTEDANPTTVLEAMAWGLVPICTPQSGYYAAPGLVNVPLDDVDQVVSVLRGLEHAPSESLDEMRSASWAAVDAHYSWDRFAAQVFEAIDGPPQPRRRVGLADRAAAARWSTHTPYMPYRRRGLAMLSRRMRASL